ncbi:MAG: cell division protein FtsA [Bacillota bacterium]|jgi:cell division protein FtsA
MLRGNIVAVFDLGSSSIKAAAGVYRKNGSIKKMAVVAVSAKGIKNGLVTDLDLAAQCLLAAKDELAKQLDQPLEKAWIGISGGTVISCAGRGCITVAGPDNEVDEFDLRRVAIATEIDALPQRREALHIIPLEYLIDGRVQTTNPRGLFGHELVLSAVVIAAELVQTQNILRLARRAGLQVDGLLYTPLIAASALLSSREKVNGAAYIDIGAEACDVVLFRNGNAHAVRVLPYGGRIIDQDIAYGFKVSPAEAEQLKQSLPAGMTAAETAFLNEIIGARITEYLEMVLSDPKSLSGLVFAGGTSRWPGLTAIAQEFAGCPCRTITGATVSIAGYCLDTMLAELFQYCLAQSARNKYNGERFNRLRSWLTGH